MDYILLEATRYVKRYKCPYCEQRLERDKLIKHIDKKHSELLPEGYTATHIVFDTINKKDHGTCIMCGKESPWNENKARYDRLCGSEKCKKEYEKLTNERIKKLHGKTGQEMLNDKDFQKKMLEHRRISGKYKFKDGNIKTYTGSYEKNFLEFMDVFLNIESMDLETPGPCIEYKYKGETHTWITDAYYAPYNLVFDIKDGGDNPNNRDMPEYRAKQKAKEDAIAKLDKYNYIRLTDNNFGQLIEIMLELKMQLSENPNEFKPIIKINESGLVTEGVEIGW